MMKKLAVALGALLLAGCESAPHRAGNVEPVKSSSVASETARPSQSEEAGLSLLDEVVRGDAGRVKALIEAGADVNVPGEWLGYTPLHWAAAGGHVDVIKLLLDNGAHVDARTTPIPPLMAKTQLTPLHLAARSDRLGAVEALLEAGAEVNARDFLGETSLHAAFTNYATHTAAVVYALIRAGADPKMRDKRNRRAIDLPMAEMLKVFNPETYGLLRDATDR